MGLAIVTWLERGILALLFGLSVWSFAIILDRKKKFSLEISEEDRVELQNFFQQKLKGIDEQNRLAALISGKNGIYCKMLQVASRAAESKSWDSVDRNIRAFLTRERLGLEHGLSVLATLGANAPFIGLFGTVLGIIRAFAALSSKAAEAGSVTSGISLALVATAAGLLVAIPAVVAFNNYSSKLRNAFSHCEALKDDYVAAYFSKRTSGPDGQ